jgi:nucleosome assembly protein 1-like 1
MSSSQNIAARDHSSDPAPTPQNTPLDNKVLASRPADLGKPKVEDIGEDEDGEEEDAGFNPASLLAQVGSMIGFY